MAHDIAPLVQQTADRLAGKQVGAVVAAVTPGTVEIRGAGRTAAGGGSTPGPDTLFEIGSVTKTFTALALARMARAGTAGLDEPLADLLPTTASVPSRDGRQITLQHLATHTSGLPRLPKGMLATLLLRPTHPDPYAHCTADALLSGLARTRLGAVPGERFRYSNLGAGLLGLALARRAGTEYEALVTREICAPLGMTDTVVTVDPARAERYAQGHSRRGRPRTPWNLADLAGAGALRSRPPTWSPTRGRSWTSAPSRQFSPRRSARAERCGTAPARSPGSTSAGRPTASTAGRDHTCRSGTTEAPGASAPSWASTRRRESPSSPSATPSTPWTGRPSTSCAPCRPSTPSRADRPGVRTGRTLTPSRAPRQPHHAG